MENFIRRYNFEYHENTEGGYNMIRVRPDNAGYLIVPTESYQAEDPDFDTIYEIEFLGDRYLFSMNANRQIVNQMDPVYAGLLMNQEWIEDLRDNLQRINNVVERQLEDAA